MPEHNKLSVLIMNINTVDNLREILIELGILGLAAEDIQTIKDDEDVQKAAAKRLPKVLEAKKVQFLKAINKSRAGTGDIESDADEAFVLKHLYARHCILELLSFQGDPLIFHDAIVATTFKQLKRPEFHLKTYVLSAKWVYANYLELKTDTPVLDFALSGTIAYVLAFARDFNDPSEDMFDFCEDGSKELTGADLGWLPAEEFTGNTIYIKRLNKLIADLLEGYSEQKYRLLNLNVTYIILLMLRRVVKTEKEFANCLRSDKTHSDYWELCPLPLDYRLPMVSQENNRSLDAKLRNRDDVALLMVLHQYGACSGRTRRVFRATSLRHMEHSGLGLPALFSKVAELYKVDEGQLWDVISCRACGRGLMNLSDLHVSQAVGRSELPPKTYNLFPYCRVLNSYYHSDMSASHYTNAELCYVLAYLVDLNLGLDVSSARLAQWTHSVGAQGKSRAEVMAAAAYEALKARES